MNANGLGTYRVQNHNQMKCAWSPLAKFVAVKKDCLLQVGEPVFKGL